MSDVVNAELLKLATDGATEEYWHACADPALKASKLAAFVKSRLQAEAQAPTTAVLTEDERIHFDAARDALGNYGQLDDDGVMVCASREAIEVVLSYCKKLDWLTVGAPAPAPTREQIEKAVQAERDRCSNIVAHSFGTNDRGIQKIFQIMLDKIAFPPSAKGDTP